MNEESLRQLVRELDRQIDESSSLSSIDRDLLGKLRRDIDELLARTEKPSNAEKAVLGELRTATERFESSHPDLAAAMAQILDLFTKLGI